MDTERNLLFGVVALQSGTVDADRLAETCAAWASEPTQALADHFVGRGLITDEQKVEVEKLVARELETYGGDSQATLAATVDGRSLEVIRGFAGESGSLEAKLSLPPQEAAGHVVLEKLSPSDSESRERYTLTHLHAKGGMGRVWLARDTALGRQIALKELRPDQSDNSIVWSRFLYEAKITAQLEHPGIVPVYEVGEGESPYYTMRFVRGRTLSEATRAYHKKRAAGEADAVGMVELLTAFVGVCHAVAYAHSRGIIHRDLKGQNVVLGDFGEVMVLDWGLAKRIAPDQAEGSPPPEDAATAPEGHQPTGPTLIRADSQDDDGTIPEGHDDGPGLSARPSSAPGSNGHAQNPSNPGSGAGSGRRPGRESGAGPDGTMQGQLLGTPAYMAPEQAQGRHDLVDERTDVYGLGAILYEILTGRPPFVAPKTVEIIRKVCHEEAIPPRRIIPTIKPGLEAVCLKALRKGKNDRYPSAAYLAQEVQRWLADEPVQAYVEPWGSRALRWARRHKALVSTAAGLMVTATIALGVSTMLVSRERDEAEAQGQQARQAVNLLTQVKDIGFEDQLDPVQKEFLEHALAYYAQFTDRASRDPKVLLEHGRAYQQMGDIQRKLGKPAESEQAYRKAMAILEPLATAAQAGPEPKRALAQTRTLLGNLLVRLGKDKDRAETLYRQAIETEQPLADAPAATIEDRLHLGRALKGQADLLRLDGKFDRAKSIYDKALSVLDLAHAADDKQNEVRHDLALAADARGWVFRDLGEIKPAERDFRRALELLDKLVAEFPTIPRYREGLAKACNSLGLIEQDAGNLASAEALLRRELPLVDRLAQDFPDRPEHSRELGRTLMNLANVLRARQQNEQAEPFLVRSVNVLGKIAAKNPEDVQIQLDLSRCHNNLGNLLRERGEVKQAIASLFQARTISEALVKKSPDKPRYREELAGTLVNLAAAQMTLDPGKVEDTYQSSLNIYEKLVAAHPDNVDYRIGQALCLRNFGDFVAGVKRNPEQAEGMLQKSLALLDTKDAASQSTDRLRQRAEVLNNLGDLQADFHRPGADRSLRDAITAFESLAARESSTRNDRHNLAIVRYNMGKHLVNRGELAQAGPFFAKSVDGFDKLAAEAPRSIDIQSHFGEVLSGQGRLLAKTNRLDAAKTALTNAVAHQRQAVRLGKNRDDTRELLAGHLLDLADINLKLGAYKEAGDDALEIPQAVPIAQRSQGCLDAARVLAKLVTLAGADAKLAPAERDRLPRYYLGRTIILLREASDSSPKLADQIKNDPDIKLLESRADFQTIMNSLVQLGG